VICGCVQSGTLKPGDILHIPGIAPQVIVHTIQLFGRPAPFARPGDLVSLGCALRMSGKREPFSGCMLMDEGSACVGDRPVPWDGDGWGDMSKYPPGFQIPPLPEGPKPRCPLIPFPTATVRWVKASIVFLAMPSWVLPYQRMLFSIHTTQIEAELHQFFHFEKRTGKIVKDKNRNRIATGDAILGWFRIAPPFNYVIMEGRADRARHFRNRPIQLLPHGKADEFVCASFDSGCPRLGRFSVFQNKKLIGVGVIRQTCTDEAGAQAWAERPWFEWDLKTIRWKRGKYPRK